MSYRPHWVVGPIAVMVVASLGTAGPNAVSTTPSHGSPTRIAAFSSPDAGDFRALLGVGGTSSDDVWAVGSFIYSPGQRALIKHWDGSDWTKSHNPNKGLGFNAFEGVSAVSASDVWAVGEAGPGGTEVSSSIGTGPGGPSFPARTWVDTAV